MPTSLLEDIRDYLVRHFLGRVQVHKVDEMTFPLPVIFTPRHEVATYPVRTQIMIRSPALLSFNKENGGLKCSNGGFRFSKAIVNVKGERVKRYEPKGIIIDHISLVNSKLKPQNGLKRMLLLPQERSSRLRWQKARPTLVPGETVLAWYGPLIEKAVLKMTLNRQRGTLLVWYDPQSRHFKPAGLYLCRRLGIGTKPEWRWV